LVLKTPQRVLIKMIFLIRLITGLRKFATAYPPPPPPHFQLVSKLTKLITITIVSFFLIGCGGGGGGSSSPKDPPAPPEAEVSEETAQAANDLADKFGEGVATVEFPEESVNAVVTVAPKSGGSVEITAPIAVADNVILRIGAGSSASSFSASDFQTLAPADSLVVNVSNAISVSASGGVEILKGKLNVKGTSGKIDLNGSLIVKDGEIDGDGDGVVAINSGGYLSVVSESQIGDNLKLQAGGNDSSKISAKLNATTLGAQYQPQGLDIKSLKITSNADGLQYNVELNGTLTNGFFTYGGSIDSFPIGVQDSFGEDYNNTLEGSFSAITINHDLFAQSGTLKRIGDGLEFYRQNDASFYGGVTLVGDKLTQTKSHTGANDSNLSVLIYAKAKDKTARLEFDASGGKKAAFVFDYSDVKTDVYRVSFYNNQLDREDWLEVVKGGSPTITLAKAKERLNISGSFYKGGEDLPANVSESILLTRDLNFYAIPDVIEITDQAGLNAVGGNRYGKYILLNDITLSGNWTPIYTFSGILNGNGYKITNLRVDNYDGNVGLFLILEDASIKNLGVELGAKGVRGGYDLNAGGIVGEMEGGSITNSYVKGSVSGGGGLGGNVGGIAGSCRNGAQITDSYFEGSVSGGADGGTGGIVGGLMDSSVTNSYATGSVHGAMFIGGIAGYVGPDDDDLPTSIVNSHFSGSVLGTNYVGGIAGFVYDSTITDNYVTSTVRGTYYVGGIVGAAGRSEGVSEVKNNAAINPLVFGIADVDRVLGGIYDGTNAPDVSNNFALDSIRTKGEKTDGAAGTPKTEAELKTQSTYESDLGWKFGNDSANPWKFDLSKNSGYPYLYWEKR
jgi:hypothetical protein